MEILRALRMRKEAFNPVPEQNGNLQTVRPASDVSKSSRFRASHNDRNYPTTRRWNKIFQMKLACSVLLFLIRYW